MKKNLWIQILLITIIAVTSGLVYNLFSGQGTDLFYRPLEVNTGANLNDEQTYRLLREGQALFIDSRYRKEFEISHLPGAVNIPSDLRRDELMPRLEAIPKDQMIVVYCSSQRCQSAQRLAGLMTYLGFERVHVYLAGFEEWVEKNYPLEK